MVSNVLRGKRWAAALSAFVLTTTLVGCTNDNGEEPPVEPPSGAQPETPNEPAEAPATEEPNEEPTLSEQDQHIADARQAYIDYLEAYDTAAETGFEPGDTTADAIGRTAGGMREALVEGINNFREYGISREGRSEVVWAEARDYRQGDGTVEASIDFEVCLDTASLTTLIDGEPQDQEGGRTVQDVQMQNQEGNWLVWNSEPNEDAEC